MAKHIYPESKRNYQRGDYRVGFVKEPHADEPAGTKWKPVSSPPCPHLEGRKRIPCEGVGVHLVVSIGTVLPSATVEKIEYDPSTGRTFPTGQLITLPPANPFEPLADRWFWYRCDTCGHRFQVRGTAVPPKAKAAKK